MVKSLPVFVTVSVSVVPTTTKSSSASSWLAGVPSLLTPLSVIVVAPADPATLSSTARDKREARRIKPA
jgi:hypothetical protein